MRIESFDYFNYTPGFRLAVQGWHELLTANLTPAALLFGYDNHTIVACDDADQPVGVLVWMKNDHLKEAFILLGYVTMPHRRRGIYRELYKTLIKLAKEAGLQRTSGMTSFENETMRIAAAHQGRLPQLVTFAQEI